MAELTSKMRRLSMTNSDSGTRRHSKKERRKSATLPLIDTARASEERHNPLTAPSSTERSPSTSSPSNASNSSPKDVPRNVYRPYNERGDLINNFWPNFDAATADFCFQCGARGQPLLCTTECTSFRMPDGSVRIYRPLYSCDACLLVTAERKRVNAEHRVRIVEQAMVFYEKAQ